MIDLVVNADDYGLSTGVDEGIRRAIEGGAVSAVSALVCGPAWRRDAPWLRAHPEVGVGLHAAVGPAGGERWGSMSGAWIPRSSASLYRRFADQRSRLEDDLGRAIDHVDAHMHVQALPWVGPAVRRVAQEAGVRVRVPWEAGDAPSFRARVLRRWLGPEPAIGFLGFDRMGAFSWSEIEASLAWLERRGVTQAEWMVHPGVVSPDHPAWDPFRAPREHQLDALLRCAGPLNARVRRVGRLRSGG